MTRSTFARDTPKDREAAKRGLDAIRVTMDRSSNGEVTISTAYPTGNLLKRAFRKNGTDLDYRIHAPRDARLIIRHDTGSVVLYDMTGDIDASTNIGDILILLPDGQYAIDAKAKVGGVYTEYGGAHRTPWSIGEQFLSGTASAAHKLFLRVKIGDIKIQKMVPSPVVTTKP